VIYCWHDAIICWHDALFLIFDEIFSAAVDLFDASWKIFYQFTSKGQSLRHHLYQCLKNSGYF
jgi:hypothetical protein